MERFIISSMSSLRPMPERTRKDAALKPAGTSEELALPACRTDSFRTGNVFQYMPSMTSAYSLTMAFFLVF